MMEFLLRRALIAAGVDWHVESSGIQARPGTPMHPFAAVTLSKQGIDIGDWVSTRSSAEQFQQADLVLTASAAHRSAVVQLAPRALAVTFPLGQFARFALAAEPADAAGGQVTGAQLLATISNARTRVQPARDPQDDLRDPIGKPVELFQQTADLIQTACDRILSPITGRLEPPAPAQRPGRRRRLWAR